MRQNQARVTLLMLDEVNLRENPNASKVHLSNLATQLHSIPQHDGNSIL